MMNTGYIRAEIPDNLRSLFGKSQIYLHQLICPCEDGYEPDHLDRDKTNNLSNNLVPKTHIKNLQNKGKHSNNTSGYKNITWDKRSQKWLAYKTVNKKRKHIGLFSDINDAIKAYEKYVDNLIIE